MFLCREDELRKLNRRWEGGQFEYIVVYGRRRVGKTAIINEFCRDKPTIFFSALNSSGHDNLRALSKAISDFENPGALEAPIFSSYDDALQRISRLGQRERLAVVIDEYPYLAKAEPSISSRLQHIIDHQWSQSRIYLILCGSSMSFMEYQVLGYESPLYGRRTAQFKIKPLRYRDAAKFYPHLTPEDNALVYGVTGGVPHYLNKLNVRGSLDEALLENVFDRSSYLFEEPANLLKQELREPALYNSMIAAIAEGASRLNDIAQKAGLETSLCSKYIHALSELGIVKKETPATEKPGKKTIYRIEDLFFRFWYRFVPSNMAAITSGRIAKQYPQAIRQFYPAYMGLVFERMCQEYLLYDARLPFELKEIGQWWGGDPISRKEVQIDIVAPLLEKGECLIGSCKFRNETVGVDELALLRGYAQALGKFERYHYVIFSKNGFTEGLQECARRSEVRLVTLQDLSLGRR